MPHRRTYVLGPLLVLAMAGPASAQEPPGLIPGVSKIRFDGIGAFKVGMTRKQAHKAAGTVYYTKQRVGDCLYWDFGPPNTGEGPVLRFHHGRLRAAEVGMKDYATR